MPVQVFTSSPINASKAAGVTPKTARPEDAEMPATANNTMTAPVEQQTYPPAQPGARPPLPVQTAALASNFQPTPTSTQTGVNPSPPQPGAVPLPPGVPPPNSSTYPAQAFSPTTALFPPADATRVDFSHPPGYQQNVHATEFTSAQRAAHNASINQGGYYPGSEGEEGVWGAAKKWAAAAGDSLAAAEEEIWRKINKD